jgi:aspartyl-tRNA(Asn)/glutamyl-tRNA(Gln) amidotransferase subunit B
MLSEMFDIDALKLSLPELPSEKRDRYKKDFGLGEESETFVIDTQLAKYFETIARSLQNIDQIKIASNYILSDMLGNLKKDSSLQMPSPENFINLILMISANEITSRVAKDILPRMMMFDQNPRVLAEKEGLLQQNDEENLRWLVNEIITKNQNLVEQYKAGKESIIQALVGVMMKETKGSANPQIAMKLLKEELSK